MKSTYWHNNKRRVWMRYFASLSFIWLCANAFVACSEDNNPNITNRATINLRALTDIESQITEIEALILVDKGSGYMYNEKYMATSLVNVGNGVTQFELQVKSYTQPVKIYFIVNANNSVESSALQYGDTEAQIKQKINYTYPSAGIVANFPMWGEYLLPSGISSGLSPIAINLYALPALARVDVNVSLAPSDFAMQSIQPYRVNSDIQIIPNSYTGQLLVSDPSIPSTSSVMDMAVVNTTGNMLQEQLYIPESSSPAMDDQQLQATCLVVGGRYKGSSEITYYRLDFQPEPTAPFGQILRNRLYTFDIQNVQSPGWPTPDEAATKPSVNIQASVVDWHDLSLDINMGGTYFLNLSSRTISLGGNKDDFGSTLIFTNVFDYTLQWADANGDPVNVTTGLSISNDYFKVTALRNFIVVDALQDNLNSSIREDYFLIVARGTRFKIKISQAPL